MPATAIGNRKMDKGISIIEILLVIIILGISLLALLGVGAYSLQVSSSLKKIETAKNLAQEAVEAVRSFRSGTTWTTDGLGVIKIGDDNPYYPKLDSGVNPPKWTLLAGTQTINGFIRKIIFNNVSRDPTTNNIESVYNPSHNDPDTKMAQVTVSWGSGAKNKVETIIYLTNWKQ